MLLNSPARFVRSEEVDVLVGAQHLDDVRMALVDSLRETEITCALRLFHHAQTCGVVYTKRTHISALLPPGVAQLMFA